jgi:hypothetical protein
MRHGKTKKRTVVNLEFCVCGNWYESFGMREGSGNGNEGVKVPGSR